MQLRNLLKLLLILFFFEILLRMLFVSTRMSLNFAKVYNQFIAPIVFPFYLTLTVFESIIFFLVYSFLRSTYSKLTNQTRFFPSENSLLILLLFLANAWYIIFGKMLSQLIQIFGVVSLLFYFGASFFVTVVSIKTCLRLKSVGSPLSLARLLFIISFVLLVNLTLVSIVTEIFTGVYNIKMPMLPYYWHSVIYAFVFSAIVALWASSTMLRSKISGFSNIRTLVYGYFIPFFPLIAASLVYFSLEAHSQSIFLLVAGWVIPADLFGYKGIFGDYSAFAYALAFGLFISSILQLISMKKNAQTKENVDSMIYGYTLLFFPGMFNEPFFWLCRIIALMLIEQSYLMTQPATNPSI